MDRLPNQHPRRHITGGSEGDRLDQTQNSEINKDKFTKPLKWFIIEEWMRVLKP
jgi:hypothetical protein